MLIVNVDILKDKHYEEICILRALSRSGGHFNYQISDVEAIDECIFSLQKQAENKNLDAIIGLKITMTSVGETNYKDFLAIGTGIKFKD